MTKDTYTRITEKQWKEKTHGLKSMNYANSLLEAAWLEVPIRVVQVGGVVSGELEVQPGDDPQDSVAIDAYALALMVGDEPVSKTWLVPATDYVDPEDLDIRFLQSMEARDALLEAMRD